MAATKRVIWLCACVRYWPYREVGMCALTMQQTSKWEKHLSYLHLGTLRVHNSVSENYKSSKKIPAHGRYLE